MIKKREERKYNLFYIEITLLILFMGVLRNGNLNLIYFSVPIFLIKACQKKQKILTEIMWMYIPILLAFFITVLFSPYFSNMEKSIIYILKIFLCIILFVCVRNTEYQYDTQKIMSYLEYSIFFLTIIAILTQNEYLWRFNDDVNKYATNRLQLFFQEPSELSEVCGVLLIIHVYFLKIDVEKRYIKLLLILIPLILSAGLSGLVYSAISIVCFFILTEIPSLKRGKMSQIFAIFISIVFILILGIILFPNNAIILRINDVLNGNDSSFNYRFTRAFQALVRLLKDTRFIGVGFGNLRTDYMQIYLWENFRLHSFSNSYFFFIAEGGIIALFFLIGLIFSTYFKIKKINVNYINKVARVTLLLFIVIFQITGGYFTDSFLWLITALIASKTFLRSEKNDL